MKQIVPGAILKKPRTVWMMVPVAVVNPTLKTLIPLLAALYERFSSRSEDDFADKKSVA